jgi:hypothetical protein
MSIPANITPPPTSSTSSSQKIAPIPFDFNKAIGNNSLFPEEKAKEKEAADAKQPTAYSKPILSTGPTLWNSANKATPTTAATPLAQTAIKKEH